MNPGISIRLATHDDAQVLARLNEAFNGIVEPADRLAQRLLDPRRIEQPILAEIAGQAVGFAALRLASGLFYDTPYAELTELYIEPAFRRQGVGRALIDTVERLAREAGAKSLVLLTDFDNNAAQSLYREMGFANHDLAMQKDLA